MHLVTIFVFIIKLLFFQEPVEEKSSATKESFYTTRFKEAIRLYKKTYEIVEQRKLNILQKD